MTYLDEIMEILGGVDEHTPLTDVIKLLKQAITLADRDNDKTTGYELRIYLIYRTIGTMYLNESMPAFVWLVEEFDLGLEQYSEPVFFGVYKLMIDSSIRNYNVSLAQIDTIIADYKQRILDKGYSLRSYYNVCIARAQNLGKIPDVKALINERDQHYFDVLCENSANEYFNLIWYYLASKELDTALGCKKLLFACKDVYPELKFTYYSFIAYSLVVNKKFDRVAEYLDMAYTHYQSLEKGSHLTLYVSLMIYAYTHINKERAWQLFESYVHWADECDQYTLMCWAIYTLPLLKEDGIREMDLPVRLNFYQNTSQYRISDLQTYFHYHSSIIAAKFDERNENDIFMKQITESIS